MYDDDDRKRAMSSDRPQAGTDTGGCAGGVMGRAGVGGDAGDGGGDNEEAGEVDDDDRGEASGGDEDTAERGAGEPGHAGTCRKCSVGGRQLIRFDEPWQEGNVGRVVEL